MSKLQKLTINLFGEGQALFHVTLTTEQQKTLQKIAEGLQMSITQALLDPFFYHRLNNNRIKSVEGLKPQVLYSGLLNTSKNQIEIWFGGRKVLKVKMHDLLDEMVLFPLYNIIMRTNRHTEMKGIFIEQREIGLIAKYELYKADFKIEALQFEIANSDDQQLLTGLVYEDVRLTANKKETLINYQTSYEQ
jgi:hypothetical protein